jgi:hypothetical protein
MNLIPSTHQDMTEQVELAIQCQSDIADELATDLSKLTGNEVDQAELNNLDGTPTTVLEIVQVAVTLISTLAPIVKSYISSKKVKKIKFGSIEVENPTAEQWDLLWKEHVSGKLAKGPVSGT